MSILDECVLIPAYGRDYKSLKEVSRDFNEGKDFRLCHPSGSTYCSIRNFREKGVKRVRVRYKRLTKIGWIIVEKGESDV